MSGENQGISADAVLAELGSMRESMGRLAGAYEALAKSEAECRSGFRATLYGADGRTGLVKDVELLAGSEKRRKQIEAWVGRAVIALIVPALLYFGAKFWELLKKVI